MSNLVYDLNNDNKVTTADVVYFASALIDKNNFNFIDSPSTTSETTYTLKYTLNGSGYNFNSGIVGQDGLTINSVTYKMYNSIVAEELF